MDAISYSHSAKQAKRIKKFIENPDSNSGLVTVPKVIGAGENITVPEGRVAVLPNVQVDGTLNIEGEVFIPSGATFSKVVETEGNQTITGVKTFSSSPIVPTPTTGDNSTKVATTAFATSQDLGVAQTWQNVASNRSAGVTYTNSTGKPIQVLVHFDSFTNWSRTLTLDGIIRATAGATAGATSDSFSFIVPNGSTYSIGGAFSGWHELR